MEFICPACYTHTAGHQTQFGDSTVSLFCSNCVDGNDTDILACCGAPLEHGSQGFQKAQSPPISTVVLIQLVWRVASISSSDRLRAQPCYSFLVAQFLKCNFHQGLTATRKLLLSCNLSHLLVLACHFLGGG